MRLWVSRSNSSSVSAGADELKNYADVARRTGETVQQVQKRFEALADARKKLNAVPATPPTTPPAGPIEETTRKTLTQAQAWRALAHEIELFNPQIATLIRNFGFVEQGLSHLPIAASGVAIGFAALGAAAVKAVEAFAELEKANAQMAAALLVTQGASGQTVDSLEKMSKALAESGTQPIASIRAAETELLKFRSIGGEAFGDVLKLSKDIAATGFADLKTSTTALAKALTDPANAIKTLDAVGVRLSVSQQRLAIDLANSGKSAQAMQVILDAVSKQVAGGDALAADTLTAAWNRLTKSGKGVLETWGKQIATGLQLKAVLDAIAKAAPGAQGAVEAEQQRQDILALARANRAGTLTPEGGLPGAGKGSFTGTTFTARFDDTAIKAAGAAMDAAKEKIAGVTDALKKQGETAGMNALETAQYLAVLQAGVKGNQDLEAAIRSQVAANMSAAQFRSTIDSLKEQAAATQIQAQAVGMSAGAAAAFTAAETAKQQAIIKGLPLTEQQTKAVEEQAAKIGAATAATQQAQLAFQLKLESGQARSIFSPEDVQTAQRLVGIYGFDIPKALASSEAATIKLNNQLQQIKTFGATFANDLVQGLLAGKSAMDALGTAAGNLGKQLTSAGITNIINKPTEAAGYIEAGIGVVTQLITGASDKQKAEQQAAAQAQSDAITRGFGYAQSAQTAGLDTSTQQGALAAFDADALKQRLQEYQAGGQAIAGLEQSLAAQRLAIINKFAADAAAAEQQRSKDYQDRLFAATNDASTLQGQLAAFDRDAQKQREDEAKAGGGAMADLEAALGAERLKIVTDYNKQIVDAQIQAFKQILDYVEGLKTSASSILSPQDQLTAAQTNFNTQLAKAQASDADAIAGITQVAQTLLEQARAFYGPSVLYGSIYNATTSALTALAGGAQGGLVGHYASGGLISGGIYGVDSVRAAYAGGGSIMLAGGEYVTQARSVNSRTLPALDQINRTGRANDNDAVVQAITDVKREVETLRLQSSSQGAQHSRLLMDVGEKTSDVRRTVEGLRTDTRQAVGNKNLRSAVTK